jgi:hypothetical protein
MAIDTTMRFSVESLVARRKRTCVWETPAPGLEFNEVVTTSDPAETAAMRLVQMRRISRQFIASVGPNDERHELRLLS